MVGTNETPPQSWTAIHEAGHCVVAYIGGVPFEDVSLLTDDPNTHAGSMNLLLPANARLYERKARAVVMTAHAGAMAERACFAEVRGWGHQDRALAEEYLAVLADNPDERPALLKEIQAELAALLHQPHVEPAIRALADALMCLETLSYDQVFNVLRPVFEGLRVALPPRVRPYGSCAPRPLDMPAGTAVWDVYDAEAGVRRTATDSGGNSVLVVANGPAAAAAPL